MGLLINIGMFLLGIVVGVILVRYGIGLGTKIVYQVKEDLPILTPPEVEEIPAYTGETRNEENEGV